MNFFKRIINKFHNLIILEYKLCKACSFKSYFESSKKGKYYHFSSNRKTQVFPIHFFCESIKPSIECGLPDTYYAYIPNCNVIGSSNVILTNDGFLLYDYLSEKSKSYVNVTDRGLLLLFNRVIHIGKYYLVNYLSKQPEIINAGIMLSGNFSDNYYHFMFEFLPKFQLITKSKIDRNVPIILDNVVKLNPQFIELIEIFNTEKRKIIYLENQVLYSVENLHCFSFLNEIPPNLKRKLNQIKSTDYAFDFNSINYLRSTISKKITSTISFTPKKIFISRNNLSKRRNNELDLYPLLQEYGYVTILPQHFSISEQFFYFSNAESIIAGSGAALTNIIFCKPQCKILVFMGVHSEITVFSSIASYLNLDMVYITPLKEKLKKHSDFTISPGLLKRYLLENDDKINL